MKMATRLSVLVFLLLITSTAVMFAQGGPEAADPSTTAFQWYTSVGGVGGATIVLVQILKRALGETSYFNKVPVWAYAVTISAMLTVLCVKVFGTLPGSLGQLVTQTVINAAIATGFYEWAGNYNTTLEESADLRPVRARRRT